VNKTKPTLFDESMNNLWNENNGDEDTNMDMGPSSWMSTSNLSGKENNSINDTENNYVNSTSESYKSSDFLDDKKISEMIEYYDEFMENLSGKENNSENNDDEDTGMDDMII
jgi:hypothetical protein